MASSTRRYTGPVLLVVLWAAALCFGFAGLLEYGAAPCDPGAPVDTWPDTAGLGEHEGTPELLMFAHALCPCTHATLAELERVLGRAPQPPRTRVVLWTDPAQPESFADSSLRDRVLVAPGLELVEDPNGELARAFGCNTSGMTLYFDATGRCRFAGGLTSGRGHEGANVGTLALDALLRGEVIEHDTAPVFGCSLHDESEAAR